METIDLWFDMKTFSLIEPYQLIELDLQEELKAALLVGLDMMTLRLIEPHQHGSLIGKASLLLSEDVGSNPTHVIMTKKIYLCNVLNK